MDGRMDGGRNRWTKGEIEGADRGEKVGIWHSSLGFGGEAGWVGVPCSNLQEWAQAQETVA